MSRFTQSAFYSALVTAFGMSWYYLIGLVLTLAQDGDLGKFLFDTFIAGLVCFALFWFVFYEFAGLLAEANKPRKRDEDEEKDKDDPKNDKS